MKVLAILSLIAVSCSAQFSSGQRVLFGEDGTITITGPLGREILINKNIYYPGKVDITLMDSKGMTRKFQIDEIQGTVMPKAFGMLPFQSYSTQFDGLTRLFRQYEGMMMDEIMLETLLKQIELMTKTGLIHLSVYDVLKNLEYLFMLEEMKKMQGSPLINKIYTLNYMKNIPIDGESSNNKEAPTMPEQTTWKANLLQRMMQQNQMEMMAGNMSPGFQRVVIMPPMGMNKFWKFIGKESWNPGQWMETPEYGSLERMVQQRMILPQELDMMKMMMMNKMMM